MVGLCCGITMHKPQFLTEVDLNTRVTLTFPALISGSPPVAVKPKNGNDSVSKVFLKLEAPCVHVVHAQHNNTLSAGTTAQERR